MFPCASDSFFLASGVIDHTHTPRRTVAAFILASVNMALTNGGARPWWALSQPTTPTQGLD